MRILLMAGGGGTRLWPLSTEERPKQFLPLLSEKSLLAETYERVRPLSRGRLRAATVGAPRRPRAPRSCRTCRPTAILAEPVPAQLRARDPRGGRSVRGATATRSPRRSRPTRPSRDDEAFRRALSAADARPTGVGRRDPGRAADPPRDRFRYTIESAGRRGASRFIEKPDARQARGRSRLGPPPLECRHLRLPALAPARRGAPRGGRAPRRRRALRRARGAPRPTTRRCPTSRSTSPSWRRPPACGRCRCDAGWSDVGTWRSVRELRGATTRRGNLDPVRRPGARPRRARQRRSSSATRACSCCRSSAKAELRAAVERCDAGEAATKEPSRRR